jgi:hypothetical protein
MSQQPPVPGSGDQSSPGAFSTPAEPSAGSPYQAPQQPGPVPGQQSGTGFGGPASPSPAYGSAQASGAPWQAAPSGGGPTGSGPTGAGGAASPGGGFFRAMFDFRFEHFITIGFSSFLYVIAWIVAALTWLWYIVSAIALGFAIPGADYYSDSTFTPWPLILAVLLGWIPSVIAIILMRLGLEFAVAVVRTAQNTGTLVQQGERQGR